MGRHGASSAAALLEPHTQDRPQPGTSMLATMGSHGFTPEELQNIVRGLLSGDRELQRRVVDEYMAPDCVFTHPLGTGRGRDAFYYMYRCATTWLAYDKLDFREAVVQGDRAVLLVNVYLRARLLDPLKMLPGLWLPIIAFVRFKPGPAGSGPLVAEQTDHWSMWFPLVAFAPLSLVFARQFLGPLGGAALVTLGRLADWADSCWALARARVLPLARDKVLPVALRTADRAASLVLPDGVMQLLRAQAARLQPHAQF